MHSPEEPHFERSAAPAGTGCDSKTEPNSLEVALRSTREAFFTIDCDGRILSLNGAAEQLTGHSQAQALGQWLFDIYQPVDPATRLPCREALEKLIQSGSAGELASPRLIFGPEQSERWVETTAAPLQGSTGSHRATMLVCHDVTERENAEDERRKSRTHEALGNAVSGISHDFNNVLTAILGNISLALTTRGLTPQLNERLVNAKLAGLRGQELIQRLHTFAKAGSPNQELLAIEELLRESVSAGLGQTALAPEFDFGAELWMARIDASQIGQAFCNLTQYFVSATPIGGALQIAATNLAGLDHRALGLRAGPYLKVTFQSKATHLSKEQIAELFDPKGKIQATSIGLMASDSIINGHGGTIHVESNPHEGTRFEIYLPAVPVSAEACPPVVLAPAGVAGKSKRVLLLDDEQMLRELLSCALEMLGYEVTETADGSDTITAYERALQEGHRFDLVICDLTIPGGMGGEEAVRRLHEIDPQVKAMVCTGFGADPIVTHFREHGFCGILTKPYEIADLKAILDEALAAPTSAKPKILAHDFAA